MTKLKRSLELLRTALAIGQLSDRITDGPRPRERGREMSEGVDVLAQDLRGGFPVIKGKPESNLLLESDVADKDRPVESGRPGPRERQGLNIDIGVGVGGIGKWSGMIRIDSGEQTLGAEGGRAWRVWEGISGGFCLGFCLSFFTSGTRDIDRLAGPVIDADGFETVVRLCKVNVFESVGGRGSRLSTNVSDLRDVGRGGGRLQGRLECFAIGKDDRRRGVPGNWGPHG
jgi:hypothetical protein